MTVLFVGSEMSAFTPSDSTVKERTSTPIVYDSSFSRCSIECVGSTTYAEGLPSASATDIWIHFSLASGDAVGSTSSTRFRWYDSSNNERIRLAYAEDDKTVTINYWNGSAFVSAGTFSLEMLDTGQTFDLHVVCNSGSGSITVYVAGTARLEASVSTTSITNLRKFRFVGATVASLDCQTWFSQVIVADEPTIGWRLVTRYASGAGATTDWTGAYTEIDETIYSDADFINSSVADQVELFTNSGPSLTGYSVRAVGVSSRIRRGASGPQNCRMALRVAGTTYFSGSDIALGLAYAPVQTIWETDPATTADWLASTIGSIQFGVKSIT